MTCVYKCTRTATMGANGGVSLGDVWPVFPTAVSPRQDSLPWEEGHPYDKEGIMLRSHPKDRTNERLAIECIGGLANGPSGPTSTQCLFPLCPLQEINYDSPRGGVSVITEKGELTTSYLLVQRARVSDSGKYTCAPSNANPSTVSVHILSGTYSFSSLLFSPRLQFL